MVSDLGFKVGKQKQQKLQKQKIKPRKKIGALFNFGSYSAYSQMSVCLSNPQKSLNMVNICKKWKFGNDNI